MSGVWHSGWHLACLRAGTLPGADVWTFSTRIGVVHPASQRVAGLRPGPYQPGAAPQVIAPKANPSANGAVQLPKSLSAGCSVQILPLAIHPRFNCKSQ